MTLRDDRPGAGLRDHLVRHRIAGEVATPREENLRNAQRFLDGREGYGFGVRLSREWTPDEVHAVLVAKVGVSGDADHREGVDTIDPDLTVAALDRWRDRLRLAKQRRERVLLATGHPTGVLSLHLAVALDLAAAGCEVLEPEVTWRWPWPEPNAWARGRQRHVRSLHGVHVLASGGELLHTHAPEPMQAVLAALERGGAAPPDLVVADHGWAGAAASAGIETLALADCNDPALFVGEADGLPLVTVPLDDNVAPPLYRPLWEHVTS
jgi:hypothetical protein